MYEDIIALLENNRLKEALTQLTAWAAPLTDWQLKREVEEVQTSYDLMLHYTKQGVKDPNKKNLYQHMVQKTYELADRVDRQRRLPDGTGVYYSTLRTFALRPPRPVAELQQALEAWNQAVHTTGSKKGKQPDTTALYRRCETALDELFDRIWTSAHWSEAEAAAVRNLFESPLVLSDHRAVLVSAVTLGLLNLFDSRKFLFLCEAYACPETANSQRALVGLVLACLFYAKRIQQYPHLEEHLRQLAQTSDFQEQFHHLHLQLMQSYLETDEVDRKMREDILPSMMKNTQMQKGTLDILNLDEESLDRNPDWEEWKDDTDFRQKMEELTHLQQNGADIYMGTFSHLKQYPFFQQTAHWFYPFNPKHPDLTALQLDNPSGSPSLLSTLLGGGTFCPSDQYSFCFTLLQMPESARRPLLQPTSLPEEMSEEIQERLEETRRMIVQPAFLSRQYIQDLFRYFRLCPKKGSEKNPFTHLPELTHNPLLGPIVCQPPYVTRTADFLSAHHQELAALYLYDYFLRHHDATQVEILQKAGLIHQQHAHYNEAIGYYQKADLITPDDPWTLRHLAQCYIQQGQFEQALEAYQKVEKAKPDNLSISLQIGQCLLQLKHYEKAMSYFFKVEYLGKNPQKAWRYIAWCSLWMGNLDQSKKYYDKIWNEGNPSREDCLNAGHLYFLRDEMEEAIRCYRRAHSLCKDHKEFLTYYEEDQDLLFEKGIAPTDWRILPDTLL